MTIRPAAEHDRADVEALLQEAGLPLAGVEEWYSRFWVLRRDDELLGAIGSEVHGDHVLLRSAVVAPQYRGFGFGEALARKVLEQARQEDMDAVYLLTTTAESYFPRLGFVAIDRAEAPAALGASAEMQGACPASATLMRLPLG